MPGSADVARQREEAFGACRATGTAAPARRGLEIHRPARLDARGAAAGRATIAARHCGSVESRFAGAAEASKLTSSMVFRGRDVRSRQATGGGLRRAAERGACQGRRRACPTGRYRRCADQQAYALNTAFMADGAMIRVAGDIGAATLLLDSSMTASGFRNGAAHSCRRGGRRVCDTGREPRGAGWRGLPDQRVFEIVVGDRADIQHVRLDE